MTIKPDDVVRRFIRPHKTYWDKEAKRPKQRAFHDKSGLSIWHHDELATMGASFDDLVIESLAGFGQAHHTIGDYYRLAQDAAQEKGTTFSIDIDWRPDTVDPPWQQWRQAHMEIDIPPDPRGANTLLRQKLALNTVYASAPEGFEV